MVCLAWYAQILSVGTHEACVWVRTSFVFALGKEILENGVL